MNNIENYITMTYYLTKMYNCVFGWWNPPDKALAPLYDADTEDNIYDECPHANFLYDKDMYLANDRYAEVVDGQIAEDNIYDECPHANFLYDKDMYLANDRYAEMVDGQIAEENARRELSEYGQFVPIINIS